MNDADSDDDLYADYANKEKGGKGGAVAQSVECVTPGEEVPSLIVAVAARFLLVGVSIM